MQILTAQTNIMIDLETMSTKSNAAIVSIGAVMFSKYGIGETFYCNVDLQSSLDYGLNIDGQTVMWWLKQKKAARKSLAHEPIDLKIAIEMFADWLDEYNMPVWGNGSDFDNVILANAFKAVGQDLPWRFRDNRCYRTVQNQFPDIPIDKSGVSHNALDDALNQAEHLIKLHKLMQAEFQVTA